jgi:hypothetical protein
MAFCLSKLSRASRHDWIKTAQRVAAIMAAISATMVAWWNVAVPRLVFSPEQTSDTLPIDQRSCP